MIFAGGSKTEGSLLCFDESQARAILKIVEEAPLKDEKIKLLELKIASLEKENDLLARQLTIQEKMLELSRRETEMFRQAFEREKDLTDRALKLAELNKPSLGGVTLGGIAAGVAFLLGILVGK